MALGEPLNAAAQAVTLSGGNIQFDGAAVDGHQTFAAAGAVDAAEYHIELRGAEGWELLRVTYATGSPDSAPRPAPLRSSNGGAAVAFAGAVEAYYVLPGVKSELQELLGTAFTGTALGVLHRAAQTGTLSGDGLTVSLDGSAKSGARTLSNAGAEDGILYPVLLAQSGGWEYHHCTFTAGGTPTLDRGTPVQSSAVDDSQVLTAGQSVDVFVTTPGIQADLKSCLMPNIALFQATLPVTGQIVLTAAGGTVDLDDHGTPDVIDSSFFTHNATTGEVTIQKAGIYKVTGHYTCKNNDVTTRSELDLNVEVDVGAGYSVVEKRRAHGNRNATTTTDRGASHVSELILSLAVGDKVKLSASVDGAEVFIDLNWACLTIVRLGTKAFTAITDAQDAFTTSNSWTAIVEWQATPELTDSIFSFDETTGDLTVNEAGLYLLDFGFWGIGNTAGDRNTLGARWLLNTGSGYNEIEGSQQRYYGPRNSDTTNDESAAYSCGMLVRLSAGDILRPQGIKIGNPNIQIAAGDARMTVVKVFSEALLALTTGTNVVGTTFQTVSWRSPAETTADLGFSSSNGRITANTTGLYLINVAWWGRARVADRSSQLTEIVLDPAGANTRIPGSLVMRYGPRNDVSESRDSGVQLADFLVSLTAGDVIQPNFASTGNATDLLDGHGFISAVRVR